MATSTLPLFTPYVTVHAAVTLLLLLFDYLLSQRDATLLLRDYLMLLLLAA